MPFHIFTAHDSFGTFSAKSTQKHLGELKLAIDQVHLYICFHPAQTVIPLKTCFCLSWELCFELMPSKYLFQREWFFFCTSPSYGHLCLDAFISCSTVTGLESNRTGKSCQTCTVLWFATFWSINTIDWFISQFLRIPSMLIHTHSYLICRQEFFIICQDIGCIKPRTFISISIWCVYGKKTLVYLIGTE